MQFCHSLSAVMYYSLLTFFLSHTEQFEVSCTPGIFFFISFSFCEKPIAEIDIQNLSASFASSDLC